MSSKITEAPPPVSKRKRVEDSEGAIDNSMAETIPAIQSQSFWFYDGSLILHAEDTCYRVHKHLLARHSKVFRDMIRIPQPEDDSSIEEPEVVHVSDTKKDWEFFLEFIYWPLNSYDGWKDFPVPMLISMLRLGHKYQCDRMETIARTRLKEILPTTLSEWDSCETFYYTGNKLDDDYSDMQHVEGYEFDLLNVCLELGLRNSLPAAYLLCNWTCENLSTIFNGLKRKDGTVSTIPELEQRKLVIGRENLANFSLESFCEIFVDQECVPSLECTTKETCTNEIIEYQFQEALERNIKGMIVSPLFDPYSNFVDMRFCRACQVKLCVVYNDIRTKFWNHLPEVFQLPPWNELADST